ncbi:MAG: LysR substrate-binding domain-containing protein [Sediminimonas sp.]|uniref:LysR substrate-binding domain-containing protein n=1 Tax=Sediminimonas sp. TaxID=2823379 RepID=UPI00287014BE|nr:LysR substrate-binding domain-containing protein [Sediminimonas sp.]MDR9485919.1 LysR substrate-binding domain-containing protein [Sediminimonas sp.]
MNISLRQIATFREVMRSGSISQAARTVMRTQPAVSSMISTLEEELGFSLFTREHGKLTPTPEAHFFLEECEAILDRLERTERTISQIRALEAGKLRIACHPAASGLFMPRLLTDFLAGKDDLDVELIMRSSSVIEDMIASQQYDLGFSETPIPRASIDQTDFDLECVCVLRADDPLAQLDEIAPQDLDGRPMAVLFENHATTMQTASVFEQAGCTLKKRVELRTSLPGLQFVSAGVCHMICDMITAYSYIVQGRVDDNLVVRRFRPLISNSVSILTPGYATRSLTTQALSAHLEQSIREMQATMATAISSGAP